jgi:hypothetical protein
MNAAKAQRRQTAQTCGTYRGRFYRLVRLNEVFPHTHIRSFWWVLDDGSHFKTLSALIKHIDCK